MPVVTDNSQTLINALARIESLEKELATSRAEGMPAAREELQKLLNAAYRKGNQDAHAAREILADLVRKRYPRMLERGNPLYDAVLDGALKGVQPATLPEPSHEEWEALAAKSHIGKNAMVDYLAGAAAYGLWLRGNLPAQKDPT